MIHRLRNCMNIHPYVKTPRSPSCAGPRNFRSIEMSIFMLPIFLINYLAINIITRLTILSGNSGSVNTKKQKQKEREKQREGIRERGKFNGQPSVNLTARVNQDTYSILPLIKVDNHCDGRVAPDGELGRGKAQIQLREVQGAARPSRTTDKICSC